MKIKKSILFSIIAFFIGAVLVFTFDRQFALADKNESNHNTMNSKNDHQMQLQGKKPTMPGQEAFGTIQEIVNILENDPKTDWSKVNIPTLREHLIDMNELTLNTIVDKKELQNGLEMKVTGDQQRTINAIHRMVPTHVKMTLSKIKAWNVKVKKIDNGVILTATSQNKEEVEHIKGLGFIGLMTTGANHPLHHLMIAKGEMPYPPNK